MITGADEVGEHTYYGGKLTIKRWDNKFNPPCKVKIGKFCSLADNIEIATNGNHKYDRISTFPFAELGWIQMDKDTSSAYGNGDVVIGNDVWIASNVKINSGLKIGDGSIIASNSVIVRDVEPYSIVGGNPAKLIKYRFEKSIIDKLLKIQWWNWEKEKIQQALPLILKNDHGKEFTEKYSPGD